VKCSYADLKKEGDLFMKKQGFTLTEILITLTIIGVIAALTIPNLMTSVGKSKTKTQLLKLESELNQAIQLYENNNGSFSGALNSTESIINAFASVMLTTSVGPKPCSFKYQNGAQGWNNTNQQDMVLKNGMEIMTDIAIPACNGWGAHDCNIFYVDLNGQANGPNTLTGDIFNFSIAKDPTSGIFSVIPFGQEATHPYNPTINAESRCSGWHGHGCAAELINGL